MRTMSFWHLGLIQTFPKFIAETNTLRNDKWQEEALRNDASTDIQGHIENALPLTLGCGKHAQNSKNAGTTYTITTTISRHK